MILDSEAGLRVQITILPLTAPFAELITLNRFSADNYFFCPSTINIFWPKLPVSILQFFIKIWNFPKTSAILLVHTYNVVKCFFSCDHVHLRQSLYKISSAWNQHAVQQMNAQTLLNGIHNFYECFLRIQIVCFECTVVTIF